MAAETTPREPAKGPHVVESLDLMTMRLRYHIAGIPSWMPVRFYTTREDVLDALQAALDTLHSMTMSADDQTPTPSAPHPAWDRYHRATRLWEGLMAHAAQAHRLMEDAADELEQAGEIVRDHR